MKKLSLLLLLTTFVATPHIISIPPEFGKNFHESMATWKEYELEKARQHHTIQCAKRLYDRYVQNLSYYQEELIPKVIHHIWLGKAFPQKQQILYHEWVDMHPDWFHVLWVDNPVNYSFGVKILHSYDELQYELKDDNNRGKTLIVDARSIPLENQKAFDRGNNYGEKSDILRYEILYVIGGLYVDTDFQPVKKFDIFHHTCKFYTGLSNIDPFDIFNGLLASAPNHPLLNKCIKKIKSGNLNQKSTLHKTGPYFFTQCIEEFAKNETIASNDLVVFPSGYFYPWPHKFRSQKRPDQIIKWIQDETYGIHHWHVSWLNS